MELEIKTIDESLVVKPLNNRIDISMSANFKEQLLELINEGNHRIILNLHKVHFIDSSGLGALLSIHKAITHRGTLAICEVSDTVNQLFTLTKTNNLFNIYPTEPLALAAKK